MDIKKDNFSQQEEVSSRNVVKPVIRTMEKDISFLQGVDTPKPDFSPKPQYVNKPAPAKTYTPPSYRPVSVPTPPKAPTPPASLPVKEKKGLSPITSVGSKYKALPKPSSRKKVILVSLIFILILGLVGGFFYWWNYLRVASMHYQCQDNKCISVEGKGEDQCQTDQDCFAGLMMPESLIPVDEIETIELSDGQESLLLDRIKSVVANQTQDKNTFKRILIKINGRHASLNEILNNSGISIPENILSLTSADNYTLFSYAQSEGNRIGLIIKLESINNLNQHLRNWEGNMINDLNNLILEKDNPVGFTDEFQDNNYSGTDIRYINFPDPGLSIDYAIIDNKLIITTSRESTYSTINALINFVD